MGRPKHARLSRAHARAYAREGVGRAERVKALAVPALAPSRLPSRVHARVGGGSSALADHTPSACRLPRPCLRRGPHSTVSTPGSPFRQY
jgi:hypothetical protein